MPSSIPIIDSHIHLYPSSELPTLAWTTPSHPLWGQHSIDEYRTAATTSNTTSSSSSAAQPTNITGFIVIEADRKVNNAESSTATNDGPDPESELSRWQHPLAEISFLARIATDKPRKGEGHGVGDSSLVLGIIPWAPIPSGPVLLARYLAAAQDAAEESWAKVRGFRYLLQDKPNGTMLADPFIESLKFLGRKGYVFEVGVDQHARGRVQLEELVEMIDRVHEGVAETDKTVFIVNHMCKPDLTVLNPADPSFIAWRTAIYTLSKCDSVYMKLSGAFSEMSPALRSQPHDVIFESIVPWLAPLVAAFGARRLMFGSDWPVCTMNGEDRETSPGAWDKWRLVVERLCDLASFSEEETQMVFAGTARAAYGLDFDRHDEHLR